MHGAHLGFPKVLLSVLEAMPYEISVCIVHVINYVGVLQTVYGGKESDCLGFKWGFPRGAGTYAKCAKFRDFLGDAGRKEF